MFAWKMHVISAEARLAVWEYFGSMLGDTGSMEIKKTARRML